MCGYVCDSCLETKKHGKLNKRTGMFICTECLKGKTLETLNWEDK